MSELINLSDYPALSGACWDMHNQFIEPEQVFQIYESKWTWVTMSQIPQKEIDLIKELAQKYGGGILIDRSWRSNTQGQVIDLNLLQPDTDIEPLDIVAKGSKRFLFKIYPHIHDEPLPIRSFIFNSQKYKRTR